MISKIWPFQLAVGFKLVLRAAFTIFIFLKVSITANVIPLVPLTSARETASIVGKPVLSKMAKTGQKLDKSTKIRNHDNFKVVLKQVFLKTNNKAVFQDIYKSRFVHIENLVASYRYCI